jgi:hypothetical protein
MDIDLEKLIKEQMEIRDSLKAESSQALKKHYLLLGAYRQAAAHLSELQGLREKDVPAPIPTISLPADKPGN